MEKSNGKRFRTETATDRLHGEGRRSNSFTCVGAGGRGWPPEEIAGDNGSPELERGFAGDGGWKMGLGGKFFIEEKWSHVTNIIK